jgi:hypothetical protein
MHLLKWEKKSDSLGETFWLLMPECRCGPLIIDVWVEVKSENEKVIPGVFYFLFCRCKVFDERRERGIRF